MDANNFQTQFKDVDDHVPRLQQAIVSLQQKLNTSTSSITNKEKIIAEFTRFSKISQIVLQHSKLFQNKNKPTAQKFIEVLKIFQNSLSILKQLTS